ncbi:MAG: hypothetical protein AAFX99_09675 [Myxococcota bacterium]
MPYATIRIQPTLFAVLFGCLLIGSVACSDDDGASGTDNAVDTGMTSAPDTATMTADTDPPEDTSPPEDTAPPEDTEPPEDTTPPEDTSPPEDTAPPEDTDEVRADVPIDASDEGQECLQTPECEEGRICLEGVCTFVPEGQTFVETNYVLEEPEEISAVVSVLKGFVGQTGFFMTDIAPLADNDTLLVTYGGGDPAGPIMDGVTPTYRWQRPDELPTFSMSPYADPERPLAGESWMSEVFDYELVALFEFDGQQNRIGLEVLDTVVEMRFSPGEERITRGFITGFITRQEAEDRWLNFGSDCDEGVGSLCCIVSVGVCPTYNCSDDPELGDIAAVLDCNGAEMDADLDPEIPGPDAYQTTIFFESIRVHLEGREEP